MYFTIFRNFQNVIDIIVLKMRETSKAQIVLYWHHCLLHLLKFLDM